MFKRFSKKEQPVAVVDSDIIAPIQQKQEQKIELGDSDLVTMMEEILSEAFVTHSLSQASKNIASIIRKYYKMDFVTLLINNEDAMDIISSNVSKDNYSKIEAYCTKILNSTLSFKSRVVSSESGSVSYVTSGDRRVGFSAFLPLMNNDKILGGILLENQSDDVDQERTRFDLYTKVFQNTSLVLKNLIYVEDLVAKTSTDGLTNVFNRRYIDLTLDEQFKTHRNLGLSFGVAMLDIDHFKKFNDTYGHQFGDLVLKEVAKALKTEMYRGSWVARYGGEEFLIFFPRCNETEVIEKVEGLREKIEGLKLSDGNQTTSVTASFGLVFLTKEDLSVSSVVGRADAKLYDSKSNGRNRVTY